MSIIHLCKDLQNHQKEYILSKQVLQSGTAIGALIEEALQGESKKDFIHKLSIANKEANETNYWLALLKATEESYQVKYQQLINDNQELIRLLVSIIKTSKSQLNNSNN